VVDYRPLPTVNVAQKGAEIRPREMARLTLEVGESIAEPKLISCCLEPVHV